MSRGPDGPATGRIVEQHFLVIVLDIAARQAHGIGMPQPLSDLDRMHGLMGFDEVWAFEKAWEN